MSDYLITMDDKRLEDFGLHLEEGQDHPATAYIEHNTLEIPGMPGVWDFGSELREKRFSFPIATKGLDRVEMQQRLSALVVFLCDEYGKPRNVKLAFDYEPDKFYIAKLSEQFTPDMRKPFTRFLLPFVSYEGYKYSALETHEINWDSTTATYDDSWSMDTVFVDDMVITTPQTVESYVNGYAISPTILINGSGNNVTFRLNGKSFSLKNFTNSIFEIRGKDFTVFKNGNDTFTEMTGEHLTLLPGLNKIQITGINMNFNLSIKVRDEFN